MEIWVHEPEETGAPAEIVPAVALRFWLVQEDRPKGTGKTLRHSYTPGDYSFDRNWEILEG